MWLQRYSIGDGPDAQILGPCGKRDAGTRDSGLSNFGANTRVFKAALAWQAGGTRLDLDLKSTALSDVPGTGPRCP